MRIFDKLPVIQHSTTAGELNAWHMSSVLQRHVNKFTLMNNMRVQLEKEYFGKTFAEYWEWGDGNRQICTMHHIVDKLLLHNINQKRINS